MEQKVIQIGNSAGVILPTSLRRKLNIKEGEKLLIEEIPGRDAILIRKKSKKSFSSLSVSVEFFTWLEEFSKSHADVLRELAKR